jgi:hypothetical protein
MSLSAWFVKMFTGRRHFRTCRASTPRWYNQSIGGSNATVGTSGTGHVGDGGGGALDKELGGTVTISDSTFDHNQAIGGSNIQGNSNNFIAGWGHGGAINNSSWNPIAVSAPGAIPSILIASNLTITNNQAIGGAADTGPLAGVSLPEMIAA